MVCLKGDLAQDSLLGSQIGQDVANPVTSFVQDNICECWALSKDG